MKAYRTPYFSLTDSNASAHFSAGSALSEFMAGRLGAPGCWPGESHRNRPFLRVTDEMSSLQRWENDGGKIGFAAAPTDASSHFHLTRPLLTQLI